MDAQTAARFGIADLRNNGPKSTGKYHADFGDASSWLGAVVLH